VFLARVIRALVDRLSALGIFSNPPSVKEAEMQVRLRVTRGKSEGREVKISGPEFLVGRGKECDLRPRSDVISRRHCLFVFSDDGVVVRDLGSRNGTFVNGAAVDPEAGSELKAGDRLKIGKLEFDVLIDRAAAEEPKVKVLDRKEAAALAATANLEDSDIASWLQDAEESEIEEKLLSPETRQFKLDDTDRVRLQDAVLAEAEGKETKEEPGAPQKKPPAKLPASARPSSKDSREAAANMLKKFFNNR
jgi:pSer/pThr/pTyr-binding forkhead associated (FHA) protein